MKILLSYRVKRSQSLFLTTSHRASQKREIRTALLVIIRNPTKTENRQRERIQDQERASTRKETQIIQAKQDKFLEKIKPHKNSSEWRAGPHATTALEKAHDASIDYLRKKIDGCSELFHGIDLTNDIDAERGRDTLKWIRQGTEFCQLASRSREVIPFIGCDRKMEKQQRR